MADDPEVQHQPRSIASKPNGGGSTPAVPVASSANALEVFLNVRHRLFVVAHRILGSAAEAEDVVQDAWIRWQSLERSSIRDATAFLTTLVTRLAINVLQSARSRRETYVDSWLPEPIDPSADPRLTAERGQRLAIGMLMLFETLTPLQQAAFILREAFDYPYRDIATVLELEETNARQVVTRARESIGSGRRLPVSVTERQCVLDTFVSAARNGDVADLENLFRRRAGVRRHRLFRSVTRRTADRS